jgi:hypothetical protein
VIALAIVAGIAFGMSLISVVMGFQNRRVRDQAIKDINDWMERMAEKRTEPLPMCASCQGPVGDLPVQVDDVVTALVNHAPIKVRFFICQSCASSEVAVS